MVYIHKISAQKKPYGPSLVLSSFDRNNMKLKGILALSVLALSLFACQSEAPKNVSNVAPQDQNQAVTVVRKNIVFFGNSLTAAYQLSPEQGFTALLQLRIDSLELPYTCVNAGLSGETTADGVNRIEWVLQQPVDIFVPCPARFAHHRVQKEPAANAGQVESQIPQLQDHHSWDAGPA